MGFNGRALFLFLLSGFFFSWDLQAKVPLPESIRKTWAEEITPKTLQGYEESFRELQGAFPKSELGFLRLFIESIPISADEQVSEEAIRLGSAKLVVLEAYRENLRLQLNISPFPFFRELEGSTQILKALLVELFKTRSIVNGLEEKIAFELERASELRTKVEEKFLRIRKKTLISDLLLQLKALKSQQEQVSSLEPLFINLSQSIEGLTEAYHAYSQTELSLEVQKKYDSSVAVVLSRIFPSVLCEKHSNQLVIPTLHLYLMFLALKNHGLIPEEQANSIRASFESLREEQSFAGFIGKAGRLQETLNRVLIEKEKVLPLGFFAESSPIQARGQLLEGLGHLRKAFQREKEQLLRNRSFLDSWTSKKKRIERALERTENSIRELEERRLQTTSLELLQATYKSFHLIQMLASQILSLSRDYSLLIEGDALLFEKRISELSENSTKFLYNEDWFFLRQQLLKERAEGVWRAYVNRQTVTTLTTTTLFGASLFVSGGVSSLAYPALHAAALNMLRATLVTSLAIDLGDRYYRHGAMGLANFQSAFDVLFMSALSYRLNILPVTATTTGGKLLETSRNWVGHFQYQSSNMLAIAVPAYGTYCLFAAESISKDLAKEGVLVSPLEIRRRAMTNLALSGFVFYLNNSHIKMQRAKYGDAFEETFQSYNQNSGLFTLRQIRALRTYYQQSPGPLQMAKTALWGGWYAAFDVLIGLELSFMSFTTPDFWYEKKIEAVAPYPELKDGETAVVLIGFDPKDILYFASWATHANEHLSQLYGDKLYFYDFTSPEDMVRVLEGHRSRKGKIRFLKIMTHGLPGKLKTRGTLDGSDALNTQGTEFIDAEWLLSNGSNLREMARRVFAPGIRIVLFSCLTGANLKKATADLPKDAGDRFLEAAKTTLLSNTGRMDASTRVLVALDTAFGSFFKEGVKNSFDGPLLPHYPTFERTQSFPLIEDFSQLEGAFLDEDPALSRRFFESSPAEAKPIDMAPYNLQRVVRVMWHLRQYLNDYGFNLEGGFWGKRYNSVEVSD